MAKLPSFQFYPGDWRKDPGIQGLDYHTRGIWFEMLLMMHESDERGVLASNGEAFPVEAIAIMFGQSVKKMKRILAQLLVRNVASRRQIDGAIYNRRMVKDEALRIAKMEGGEKGAEHGIKGKTHGNKGGRPSRAEKKTPLDRENKPPMHKGARGVLGGLAQGQSETPLKPPPSSSSSSSSSSSESPSESPSETSYPSDKNSPAESPPISPAGGLFVSDPEPITCEVVESGTFAEFWDEYPKKKNEEAAKKAFAKLKPSAELFREMLAAVVRQKRSVEWTNERGKYIPYAAKWIKEKRWQDEDETDTATHLPFTSTLAADIHRSTTAFLQKKSGVVL